MLGAISVVIADDHRAFREDLVTLLSSSTDFRIVGVAANGPKAACLIGRHKPDLAILDLWMEGTSTTVALAAMISESPSTRVVIVSGTDDPHQTAEVLAAGASAFLTKGTKDAALLDTLRTLCVR